MYVLQHFKQNVWHQTNLKKRKIVIKVKVILNTDLQTYKSKRNIGIH